MRFWTNNRDAHTQRKRNKTHPWLTRTTQKKKIHQMHRDYVTSTPEGAEPLAENDVCATQGFLVPGRAITVQGHPEFTGDIVSEILGLRVETKIIGEDMYRSGMDRVRDEHDGVRIARAFLKFMRGQLG